MLRLAFALALLSSVMVWAATDPTSAQPRAPQHLTRTNPQAHFVDPLVYWSPERLAGAKPLPLPRVFKPLQEVESLAAPGAGVVGDGRAPTAKVLPAVDRLYYPSAATIDAEVTSGDIETQNAGTFGAHFSSSRLVPPTANTVYPYRTVGRLFFTTPQGDASCSASVIGFRIIATAGHCVHRGFGGAAGFYTNFAFVPGLRNGVAPFQTWNHAFVVVTSTWATGGGGVPNAADYAMLEMQDRVFSGITRRIGEVTGFLGWQTLALSRNHAHLLGYPCNHDSCQQMHQVTAGNFRNTAPNNVEYGSDMRGGSSGGPWVQNFGMPAVGQAGGVNGGMNRVVGVTSYGYVSTDPKVQGASIPDNRWVQILNTVCAHRAGNCP